MKLFANLNLYEASSIKDVLKNYKQLVKPAYEESLRGRYGQEICADENRINGWIANAKAWSENRNQSGIDIRI